jgi:hypothetical protein
LSNDADVVITRDNSTIMQTTPSVGDPCLFDRNSNPSGDHFALLSKEIYNKLSPLENLEVDSIKGISKWKSDMETDINFSDVFCNLYLVTSNAQ